MTGDGGGLVDGGVVDGGGGGGGAGTFTTTILWGGLTRSGIETNFELSTLTIQGAAISLMTTLSDCIDAAQIGVHICELTNSAHRIARLG